MAKAEAAVETPKYIPILSRLRAPEGATRPKRRRGRGHGSQLGKTSGKGMKGQKARHPGNFSKMGFEGGQTPLHRRLPKFGFVNLFATNVVAINVQDLARFEAGAKVDVAALRKAGLVKGRFDQLKVLGKGEIAKAVTVTAHAFSETAKSKIEKAGGTVHFLDIRVPKPVVRHKNKTKKSK